MLLHCRSYPSIRQTHSYPANPESKVPLATTPPSSKFATELELYTAYVAPDQPAPPEAYIRSKYGSLPPSQSTDGTGVGIWVGYEVGSGTGKADGIADGTAVGLGAGSALGTVVGIPLGIGVGLAVGWVVGTSVGCGDGSGVGA